MKIAEQNKIKLRKMELDKKYIARKLVEISKNSPIIFSNLRKFKSKCKTKYKYRIFTHEKHLIKLLKINQRTLRLLRDEEYIKHFELSNGQNIMSYFVPKLFNTNDKRSLRF